MNLIQTLTISAVWSKVWPFLVAILFFGLLIFFHELGHFTFAKIFKVKVNEFSIGMGPALFKFKKGETTYAVRLFPIGGYVSMEGEDEKEGEEYDDRAFFRQKAWKRFIIVAAGGVINLLMGIVIVGIMLGTSDDLIGTTQIHSFVNLHASEYDGKYDDCVSSGEQGLKAGDKFVEINGRRVISDYDISYFMSTDDDGVFDFVVERDGKKVAVNGVRFPTQTFEYQGQEHTTIVYDFIIVGEEKNVGNLITTTLKESVSYSRLIYMSLFDLVKGTYKISDLSGPVGTVTYIADAAEESAKSADYTYLYTLLALIALNIGLFNLLPFPALDGGRLFFIFIEMIFRKPVPRKFEGWVHAIGMVLLLLLMAFVCFSDIWKIIKG